MERGLLGRRVVFNVCGGFDDGIGIAHGAVDAAVILEKVETVVQ